eukprot:1191709-Prorocentrum_minimum.AAC.2
MAWPSTRSTESCRGRRPCVRLPRSDPSLALLLTRYGRPWLQRSWRSWCGGCSRGCRRGRGIGTGVFELFEFPPGDVPERTHVFISALPHASMRVEGGLVLRALLGP